MTTAAVTSQSRTLEDVAEAITTTVAECGVDVIKDMPQMQQAIVLARGVLTLRRALNEKVVTELFMPLQGSRLGFRTDKDKDGGYPWQVVRDCVVDALIRGFNVVGNEFNIIADGPYYTKEAFERKVHEFPGVTDVHLEFGVPVNVADKGALVPCVARWKRNGKDEEIVRDVLTIPAVADAQGVVVAPERKLDQRIPVRVNAGQGADAILGKAKRKILYQIFERLVGKTFAPPEGDVFDTTGENLPADPRASTRAAVDDLVNKHGKRPAAPANGATASAANADASDRDVGQEG